MSLHIEGRRWFRRGPGNTYHSVRIFEDGKQIAFLPFQYGYGDGYIETALEWLESNGHIAYRKRAANGSRDSGTYFLREGLGASYSVIDVDRKRDL